VIGNEALVNAIENPGMKKIEVTVVALVPPPEKRQTAPDAPLKFESVRLLAYED
jgi:hypothetical protein